MILATNVANNWLFCFQLNFVKQVEFCFGNRRPKYKF